MLRRLILSCPFLVRTALCCLRHVIVSHHYDFFKTPNVVTQASGHAGSDPQRLVDAGEVVINGVDRDHSRVILNLFAETIGQSGKAPHTHPHRQIVTFHVGCAHVLGIGIATDCFHLTADRLYPVQFQTEALPASRSWGSLR